MKVIKQTGYDKIFPYIAYLPEKISAKPAMIIQLHGAGERGNGGDELDKVLVHGFPNVVTDDNLKDCILLMPQCPTDSFWVARIESIKKFIDQAIAEFSVDTDRVYLCGISMGGYGTWNTAMAFPDMFAAIVPCCGGGPAWGASVLKMPVWAFHGLEDDVVLSRNTTDIIDRLKVCNPNVRCTLYEGVGHNSWEKAFSEELLSWLLEQKK